MTWFFYASRWLIPKKSQSFKVTKLNKIITRFFVFILQSSFICYVICYITFQAKAVVMKVGYPNYLYNEQVFAQRYKEVSNFCNIFLPLTRIPHQRYPLKYSTYCYWKKKKFSSKTISGKRNGHLLWVTKFTTPVSVPRWRLKIPTGYFFRLWFFHWVESIH